ncbi:type IV toxin-antitoxin system AbiEi family antitoxin domain-containing protein [Arthrobacter sp. TMN-50]
MHRLFLLNPDPLIHITERPGASATSHARDVRLHQGWLAASDVTRKFGFLSTSLERTAVDCSRIFQYPSALITIEHALKLGASRERMDAIVASLANHKGIGRARKVLRNASQLSESPGETVALDILRSMPLPMPEQQALVSSHLGGFRLHFAWREPRAALMIGGWAKYSNYQLTAVGLLEERRHEEALTALGWTFLRIEWTDLFREAEFKGRILAHLRRAGARHAA